MNNKKINLIFGENGTGKSWYYSERVKEVNYITLNYDIENWYFDDKKYISQERYLNEPIEKEIKDRQDLLYKNKEIFGKAKKVILRIS